MEREENIRDNIIKLPKIELHCHLDGSLSREFVEKRLGRTVQEAELSVSDDCTSLAQYLEKFDLPGQCIQDEKGLEGAAYDVLKGMHRENVVYAEIRFAPLLSENESMSCERVPRRVGAGQRRKLLGQGTRRAAQKIDAAVAGDAVDPGRGLGAGRVEARPRLPGAQQHVLGHVLGRGRGKPPAHSHRLQPRGVEVEQPGEGPPVGRVAHRKHPARLVREVRRVRRIHALGL